MNDPGGIFGASHCVGDTCLSAGASAHQVPAVCRGAFGSFCRALVVCGSVSASGACYLPWGIWIFLSRARCVALRAHCVLLFFVWIFSSRAEGPRPSQKVSKRICRLCFGLHVAKSRSDGTGVLSGNAAAWVRTHIHVYVLVAGGTHGTPLHPPRLLQGLADAAAFPESATIILGPNQTIQ